MLRNESYGYLPRTGLNKQPTYNIL